MANSGEGKLLKCAELFDVTSIPDTSFHQFLLERMGSFNGIALTDATTKVHWTFPELVQASRKLAAGLQEKEALVKGQCVAIAMPNCPEFFITILAVAQCGGVFALVNPIYEPRELEHVTSIIRPTLWICCAEFSASLAAMDKGGHSARAIVLDKADSPWHALLKAGRPEAFHPPSIQDSSDTAAVFFSSGTSGLPKGVMLSHRNLVTSLCQSKSWRPDEPSNLGLLPMYHTYGFHVIMISMVSGFRVVMMPRFSFPDMLQVIQDYRVEVLPIVPPIAILLAKHPIVNKYDLGSVKGIISSGAPISLDVIELIQAKYKWNVLQGYGMTECTLITHFTPRDQPKVHGSIGKLMPFYEAKIVDQMSGQALGCGELGEICVRGPMVMKGYLRNQSATDEMIDSDGWLHTGDIGYYDEKEYFYVVDRLKELIKYKGLQVAPSELEHLLLSHPEVIEAAVIGIPDEMAGELPRAYVVKRPGSPLTEDQVAEFVSRQVAPYKKLRGGVVFIEAIPKLASGKILRRQLRELHHSKL